MRLKVGREAVITGGLGKESLNRKIGDVAVSRRLGARHAQTAGPSRRRRKYLGIADATNRWRIHSVRIGLTTGSRTETLDIAQRLYSRRICWKNTGGRGHDGWSMREAADRATGMLISGRMAREIFGEINPARGFRFPSGSIRSPNTMEGECSLGGRAGRWNFFKPIGGVSYWSALAPAKARPSGSSRRRRATSKINSVAIPSSPFLISNSGRRGAS